MVRWYLPPFRTKFAGRFVKRLNGGYSAEKDDQGIAPDLVIAVALLFRRAQHVVKETVNAPLILT